MNRRESILSLHSPRLKTNYRLHKIKGAISAPLAAMDLSVSQLPLANSSSFELHNLSCHVL